MIRLAQAGRLQHLPPQVFLQSLRHQLQEFSQSENLADDQTALMIELCQTPGTSANVTPAVEQRLLILPWQLAALSELRHAISAIAQDCPGQIVAALILASFEAATNAIRHTPSLKEAALSCRLARTTESVSVELLYPVSVAFTPPAELCVDFSGESEGGFGLFIIQNSVDQAIYSNPMPGIGSVLLIKHLPKRPAPSVYADADAKYAAAEPIN
ncbi:ATP-binding protein [Undibacterium piscinae]|uniref:ATP-binding protein n=1 Tax=Undibacterium piscinae TaxID=2495591 RepID=A0A6M4A4C6_9BURK|nr:ATP-binding protein [Undibacterium piscinae]